MSRQADFDLDADEIVSAAVEIFRESGLDAVSMRSVAARLGVSPVPLYSRIGNKDALVDAIADRLGAIGRLPVLRLLERLSPDGPRQEEMANSAHLCRSALGAFRIGAPPPQGPLLLVDDLVQSGWTLTVLAAQLREAGAGPVYPLVLQRGAGGG